MHNSLSDEQAGLPTIQDVLRELEKPGRDPRQVFRAPQFADGLHDISDLREGMILEGVVTNVTRFGAFVDIGVHQDGLIHISELDQRFVHDPLEVIAVGDLVRVKVLQVEPERKRISLSRKQAGRIARVSLRQFFLPHFVPNEGAFEQVRIVLLEMGLQNQEMRHFFGEWKCTNLQNSSF